MTSETCKTSSQCSWEVAAWAVVPEAVEVEEVECMVASLTWVVWADKAKASPLDSAENMPYNNIILMNAFKRIFG